MSSFIPLPPTYAIADPQVRSVLDVLTRNMQVVIDSGAVTSTNTALTLAGGASTFGSGVSSTNITNLAPSYTLDTLTADLKRGAAEVITGVTNGTTVMKLEPAGQYVVFQHKDASVLGTTGAYAGTIRTGLGITSTGILGGYNRTSDGAWQTTFAIESATGNLTLLGTIRAASVINVGAYLGSQTVSSVLTDVSTASSNATTAIANANTALANANTALANANTAIADAAAAQADADAAIAALPAKLESTSSYILTGAVGIQNTGGISVGTLTWNSTTGVITGGSGIAITEYGLVGAQAGVAKFYIDSAGNAVFAGSLSAATGTFAGSLSAASGTFTGSLSSVGGTFTGALSAASGTFTGTLSSVNGTFTGSLVAASGTFTGDITGASNIDITGNGTFNGLTSVPGGSFASVKANTSNNAKYGVYAESNASAGAGLIGVSNNTSSSQANAIYGSMSNPNSASIYGFNYGNGFGVQGQASGGTNNFGVIGGGNTGVSGGGTYGPGVKGLGLLSGYGVECINGFRWGSYTMSQPTGSSSDVLKGDGSWGAVSFATNATNATNATYSDYLGGVIASSWARIFATNSGNANAGGSGVNLLGSTSTGIAGAYVGTSGTSNIVTFTVQTTSPSDIRLKEEVANIDLGLAFVNQLRPVSYKLKADPKHQKGYGFIADEVDQLIASGSSLVYFEPDWKVGDETGFKTIHYPSYVAVLTKAIQELSAKVTVLESK
jgi:hypothetical protein